MDPHLLFCADSGAPTKKHPMVCHRTIILDAKHISQEGVHTDLFTAREREHWLLCSTLAMSSCDSPASISEKLKKAVAVSEERIQERPRRQGRLSSSYFLAGKRPNLCRDSMSCCRRIGEDFSSRVRICRKIFAARNFGQPHPPRAFCQQREHPFVRCLGALPNLTNIMRCIRVPDLRARHIHGWGGPLELFRVCCRYVRQCARPCCSQLPLKKKPD